MKRIIFLFTLILSSVGCTQKNSWHYREVVSSCPHFESAQLKYTTANCFSGIEVQFIKGCFGTVGFLNVYSRTIPSCNAIVSIEGFTKVFPGTLMEGGQRLMLPEEATLALIQALFKSQKVVVSLEGFYSELSSRNFTHYYSRFSAK